MSTDGSLGKSMPPNPHATSTSHVSALAGHSVHPSSHGPPHDTQQHHHQQQLQHQTHPSHQAHHLQQQQQQQQTTTSTHSLGHHATSSASAPQSASVSESTSASDSRSPLSAHQDRSTDQDREVAAFHPSSEEERFFAAAAHSGGTGPAVQRGRFDQTSRVSAPQRLFHLPIEETLTSNAFPMHVDLWWRERAFTAQLFGTRYFCCLLAQSAELEKFKFIFPVSEITALEKKTTKLGLFDDSLEVSTLEHRLFVRFQNQTQRDFVHDQIQHTHRLALHESGTGISNLFLPSPLFPASWARLSPDSFSSSFWSLLKDERAEQFEADYCRTQVVLAAAWQQYFEQYGRDLTMVINEAELTQLLRKSIPDLYRGAMWRLLSGGAAKELTAPGYYELLCLRHQNHTSLATRDIAKDLFRSFPEHQLFSGENELSDEELANMREVLMSSVNPEERAQQLAGLPHALKMLRNVLEAYSWRNPSIGYCQGLNFVATFLLLYMSEESAFFCLSVICEDLVPHYYHRSMMGVMCDQQILEYLTSTCLPRLFRHLKMNHVSLALITQPWLVSLFIGHLPLQESLTLLDCFFYEGPNVLFRVALALLKQNEEAILQAESAIDVFMCMKNTTASFGIIPAAFRDFPHLPLEKIEEIRRNTRVELLHSVEYQNQKEEVRELKRLSSFTYAELMSLYERFYACISAKASSATVSSATCLEIVQEQLPQLSSAQAGTFFRAIGKDPTSAEERCTLHDLVLVLDLPCKGSRQQKLRRCLQVYALDEDRVSRKEAESVTEKEEETESETEEEEEDATHGVTEKEKERETVSTPLLDAERLRSAVDCFLALVCCTRTTKGILVQTGPDEQALQQLLDSFLAALPRECFLPAEDEHHPTADTTANRAARFLLSTALQTRLEALLRHLQMH
mmetsp:Transcript_1075/g.3320  ORF Transcript_1075/g.3320 Transcript_1075/m.3320 type:complete len:911 (+) Transcript_1075:270-3002(+)